jgi:hypothetical protein
MLFDRQSLSNVSADRVANLVFLSLVLVGLGYAISTQTKNTQLVTDLIGVSSARAVEKEMPLSAIEYFPAGYVNQAKEIQEHIQAF